MSKILVLDADGVLLNYNRAYPKVWEAAFGVKLELKNPGHFHAFNEYDCLFESEEQKQQFYAAFTDEHWADMPVLEDAKAACDQLVEMGYELVCVTSMPHEFLEARQRNFALHDLPISRTFAVGRDKLKDTYNPKHQQIIELAPVAFVDDYVVNFWGLEGTGIHKALIDRLQPDSPNADRHIADSLHPNLQHFVDYWRGVKHGNG